MVAEGKPCLQADPIHSFPSHHVENSSIAGSRQQLKGWDLGAHPGCLRKAAGLESCSQPQRCTGLMLILLLWFLFFFPLQDPNVLAKRENRGISILLLPFWAEVLDAFNLQTPPPQLLRPKMGLKPFLRKEGFRRPCLLFLPISSAKWEPAIPPHAPEQSPAQGPPSIRAPMGHPMEQDCRSGAAPCHSSPFSPAERIVESLTAAILDLVGLYCSTFNADFQTAVQWSREHGVVQEARLLSCPLSFTVYATHRIPITWAAR